jgi:hypothetical protein
MAVSKAVSVLLDEYKRFSDVKMNDLFAKNPDNLLNSWKKKNLAPST